MLPTRLNFLSSEKRKHLKQLANLQFAKSTVEIFLVVLSVIGIACLGGYWVLESHVETLLSRVENTARRNRDKIVLIENINSDIKEVKTLQNAYNPWESFMVDFFNAIPRGIALQTLTINRTTKTCTMAGIAFNRDDLLALQTSLRELPFIAEATIPIDQLIQQKTNVPFTLTFTLK
jgi:Tfp pilus assembly protein PilN